MSDPELEEALDSIASKYLTDPLLSEDTPEWFRYNRLVLERIRRQKECPARYSRCHGPTAG